MFLAKAGKGNDKNLFFECRGLGKFGLEIAVQKRNFAILECSKNAGKSSRTYKIW